MRAPATGRPIGGGIGRSKGRPGEEASGGKNRKEVYVYPLAKRCREVLRNGPPPARKRRRPPPAFAPEDAFVRLWGNMIGTVVRVANEHDRLWQQRRRVLNTLLVTLFVFRLVFSKDRQGYATTVAALWEQCRMMGIALPQATPVAASAMCRARAKLDEGLFRRLHGEILREAGAADAGKRWKGRRIFAVDGSKLNLPRQFAGEWLPDAVRASLVSAGPVELPVPVAGEDAGGLRPPRPRQRARGGARPPAGAVRRRRRGI